MKVNFCGYNWRIIGINTNDYTNGVGTAFVGTGGSTLPLNYYTLMLDDSFNSDQSQSEEPMGTSVFNSNGGTNTYSTSTLKNTIDTKYSEMSCQDKTDGKIASRTLTGGANDNQTEDLSNMDKIKGDTITANLWPLSYTEALTGSFSFFSTTHSYWLRNPGVSSIFASVGSKISGADKNSSIDIPTTLRPALFISASASVFTNKLKLMLLLEEKQCSLLNGASSNIV